MKIKGRKPEHKPLSFSTTMRNPNRIAGYLSCLLPYEGQILTHEIIMKVIASSIRNKIYKPVYINKNLILKNIYSSDDVFSNPQVEEIIINSPQKHKEAGFNYGWDSRFDTIFKLPMEFGFCFYKMDKPIKISKTGHMIIDALNEEGVNYEKIKNVFLNSMIKYQTNNPFRKNANKNIPLLLLLNVMKILQEDKSINYNGIFRQELSLFICWPNNDAFALANLIKTIRASKHFSYSDEYIYETCLKILGATFEQKNRFKMTQICGEAIDEYIRKMRSTGIISLRGNGRFIDFNSFEKETIDYILSKYSDQPIFNDKEEYYEYMEEIDPKIFKYDTQPNKDVICIKKKLLNEYAKKYSKEEINTELMVLCKKSSTGSKHPIFKLLASPVRLEFLTSIALVQNYKDIDVTPNYVIDDEGLPTFSAGGGVADIVCKDNNYNSLIEVTLMCGRQDQVNNEIVPIRRHLLKAKKENENVFSIFIAPYIHEDAKEVANLYKYRDNIDIIAFDIPTFINENYKNEYVSDFLEMAV